MRGIYYMEYVKFDMHCHTAEGSVDAKVGIDDYIKVLKSKGFKGMVVTDHDSYGGYDAYLSYGKKYDDFVVLRGIEYDSLEFGHFIVILPQDTPKEVYELMRYKGLTLDKLIYIVHCCDGILGPAHPYGEPFMSFASTMYWNQSKQIAHMVHFDFVEGYNACESDKSNLVIHIKRIYKHFVKLSYLVLGCIYISCSTNLRMIAIFIIFYKVVLCLYCIWNKCISHTNTITVMGITSACKCYPAPLGELSCILIAFITLAIL